ncbi:DUF805 domain-containing protein [Staphylococcus agnetis]|uniref:DUF805 domain-containing protein n=2 Tax=Staphylococcus agnetis TaxID=985762 RepID=UPI0004E3EB13|nr:DUF805 domain-containing protein [Staphylococcus agnetis]KFE41535.1 hypothetical protein SAGN_07353 [Staphylococcus agnetis]NJH64532.1 DUF805 domain-containing protein [Staphylococcus agnetis]NJH98424.1 DUF805 domain-containing protein [Staphylococcus agnetis]PTH48616.1 DUF805 domain-containing protein [Staphylococcus agnetis]PTH72069.1 DUF805 domain-containing protein [Staphylococcus agnetis]
MYATSQVGFLEAFKRFWLNYVNFQGRARRSEFWWNALWILILGIALFLSIILYVLLTPMSPDIIDNVQFIIGVYVIIGSVSILSLLVRRFHDNGFSMLIPIIFVVFNVFYTIFNNVLILFEEFILVNDIILWVYFISLFLRYFSLGLHIFILVICVMDSKIGANKYGPSPKYVQQEAPYIAPKQGDIIDNGNVTEAARENINTTDEETPLKENHNMDHKKM